MESDKTEAMERIKLLEKEALGTFVRLLKDMVEVRAGIRVDDDVRLEFVKHGYVLQGMCQS